MELRAEGREGASKLGRKHESVRDKRGTKHWKHEERRRTRGTEKETKGQRIAIIGKNEKWRAEKRGNLLTCCGFAGVLFLGILSLLQSLHRTKEWGEYGGQCCNDARCAARIRKKKVVTSRTTSRNTRCVPKNISHIFRPSL
jgi:hypothetical protein